MVLRMSQPELATLHLRKQDLIYLIGIQFKLFGKYKCTFSSFLAVLVAPVGLVVSTVPSSLFVYQHSHC